MIKLTVHTATYNRAYILGKAYESLRKQTNKNFEWVITDDGSTDGTEQLISEWQKNDNGFNIVYNKLSHVGIPRALNSGINKASTDWFMILDSDDYLLENAVEKVIGWIEEIEDNKMIAGVGFAKSYPDGKYVKDQEPIVDPKLGYIDASHIERKKYNLNMDMCEAHRVEYLKKYPFQCWPTEKFAPEQLGLYEMSMDGYKVRWRKEKLYVCEYLEDGMTKNDRIVKNNPMGFAMMHNQNLLVQQGFKQKCFTAMQMIALASVSGNLSYLKKSNNKPLTVLMFPAGVMLGFRRKKQFKNMD
ncbi:MAG: glycosyltransferase family 2 protein [Ruminococcus sp.]|nr:glycosyltransferase family 2 protein [Ruminococcus sp.]